jgi:hypothetical protein
VKREKNFMYKTLKFLALGLALMLSPIPKSMSQAVQQTNIIYPAQTFTATSQTGTVITLGQSPSGNGGSNSVGNITVSGSSLSTATFTVLGSSDGGNTYTALNVNLITTPATVATTTTVTAGGVYQVNLAGITQVEFQTSGTFTATSLTLTLTTSPTGIIARTSGGGSGGSGTVNSATAFSPAYYPATGTAVSGATPFNGLQEDSTTGPPAAASSSNVQSAIGNGVYVPVGGYYAGTATGAVNVLAVTLPAGIGTPTQAQLIGIPVTFTANLANTTTTPTLNISTLGAITITKCSTTVLVAGDISTTSVAQVIYNGTNYVLQNPQVGICQSSTSAAIFNGTDFEAGAFIVNGTNTGMKSAVFADNLTIQGGATSSSSGTAGSTSIIGGGNTGTGSAGLATMQAGPNTGTGPQGFANTQQSFTVAAALAATFEAVSMTATGDQVAASAAGSLTNVGIAQTVGGTGTQLYVVTNGKTTARFDGTPVIGDVACYPLSGGTVGLLHDNGTTACTLGESAGIITGQVSGSGSGATATVLIR